MTDLVKVGSRLMTDLRLRFHNGVEHVIRGTSHPASDGMAVTEGVPGDLFDRWMTEHATLDPVVTGMIFRVPDGHDTKPVPKEYGFQPALDRLIEDGEQEELRSRGYPEEEPPIDPRAGLVVPLPDPIPTPPAEEVHTTAAPSQEKPVPSEEKPQRIPATDPSTFKPAPASDSPTQDITLNPAGGTSSNQTGAAPAPKPAAAPAPKPAA